MRHYHPGHPAICDPLTALYRARAFDLTPGAPPRLLRIVGGHGMFDVTVRAVKRERVTVPAGTFDAVRIRLSPKPAPGYPDKKRFQALFGLCGEITLQVDAATKIPLRIRGVVPMGLDINAEVVLTKIQPGAPAPAAPPRAAKTGPPTARPKTGVEDFQHR